MAEAAVQERSQGMAISRKTLRGEVLSSPPAGAIAGISPLRAHRAVHCAVEITARPTARTMSACSLARLGKVVEAPERYSGAGQMVLDAAPAAATRVQWSPRVGFGSVGLQGAF